MLLYDKESQVYFEITPDNYAENPRECFDHSSTFITFEKTCSSPDKNPFESFEDMARHFGLKEIGHNYEEAYHDMATIEENALNKGIVLMPVWKYDHSGVSYAAAERCPFPDLGWDAGLVGVIYEKRNRRNIEQVKSQLSSEVKEYSQYANGDIYEITTYDKNGEILDSCGGIYNDYEDKSLAVDFANNCLGYNTCENNFEEIDYQYGIELDEDLNEHFVEHSVKDRITMHQEDLVKENNLRDEKER